MEKQLTFGNVSQFNYSDWNTTASPPQARLLLKKVHDILIFLLLIAIMFAMGCIITPKEIWRHVRRPVGVAIGMVSQFVALPLAAFCLLKILSIPALQATGMLVLASSPGGTTSNVFTYLLEGDVSLSVTMTTMSTLLALGMMPLNLWLYGSHLDTEDGLVIPYSRIGFSLLTVTTPVLVGMIFKWKLPKFAKVISHVGAYSGLLLVACTLVMEAIIFPDIFQILTWKLYLAIAILPVLSLALGFGLAFICRQPPVIRRTVAIECSVQNVGISITIISMSFTFEVQKSVIAFSYLYPIPMLSLMAIAVAVFKLMKRFSGKTTDTKVEEINMNENGLDVDPKTEDNLISFHG